MKMKYDESDNAIIRASRAVTDRVTDFLGNVPSHLLLLFQYPHSHCHFIMKSEDNKAIFKSQIVLLENGGYAIPSLMRSNFV